MSQLFYFFDGQEERDLVAGQVCDVRREVVAIAEHVPEQHHYLPRYGGRSLATMLMHLYLTDTAALWWVKTSANLRDDLSLQVPRLVARQTNQILLKFFKKRRVETTLRDLKRREAQICEYIQAVPLDVLHRDVFHPGRREPYTVEKALQVYFVQNWERHLSLMRQVEGVTGERET